MTRREINEITKIPLSSLSDWSKQDSGNWRKTIYTLLKNISTEEATRFIEMGDLDNMSLEEMDEKIHLYMEIKESK